MATMVETCEFCSCPATGEAWRLGRADTDWVSTRLLVCETHTP